jgi:hypothetical protein
MMDAEEAVAAAGEADWVALGEGGRRRRDGARWYLRKVIG